MYSSARRHFRPRRILLRFCRNFDKISTKFSLCSGGQKKFFEFRKTQEKGAKFREISRNFFHEKGPKFRKKNREIRANRKSAC